MAIETIHVLRTARTKPDDDNAAHRLRHALHDGVLLCTVYQGQTIYATQDICLTIKHMLIRSNPHHSLHVSPFHHTLPQSSDNPPTLSLISLPLHILNSNTHKRNR